ncbi:hypothetical protein [Agriterribacter sp.]|uniref:hypothetical protein n=1 Tax=Agriterribacter sp. TaxID=2821509 RepID=UPI002BF3C315|nr:hypothetical protein [Agriterribacter sp.]HRP55723.1 hypothetical protein [Agriterribacter sp.]
MKDAPYIYQIIATIATISFFLPFITLVIKKLVTHRVFIWFAAYWMLAGSVNLLIISGAFANSRLLTVTERVFNLSDAPFMLFILYKTVHIEVIKNSIKKMLPAFLCASLLVTAFTRLQDYAETLMVGIGLVVILLYIVWIIMHYIKGIKYYNTEHTLQFIYYALLFEYGISVVTFIFSYMIPEKSNLHDSFFVYYISVIISISLALYGLLLHKENAAEKKKETAKKEREAEIKFL